MMRGTDRDTDGEWPAAGQDPAVERNIESRQRMMDVDQAREVELLKVRGYFVRLSATQLNLLRDVGRFRTVETSDLAAVRYEGQRAVLDGDLRELEAQGLLKRLNLRQGPRAPNLTVVVLTRTGKNALSVRDERDRPEGIRPRQAYFAGFVKPKEVRHDAAVYRMFQAECARLTRQGASVRRVILDYELKARIYKPLAKARARATPDFTKLQLDVAQANGLKVIRGKIPLPDLRIEYETGSGESGHVDLELATDHYHAGAMATKAQAGFRFYAAFGSAAKLSRALQERDITVAILAL